MPPPSRERGSERAWGILVAVPVADARAAVEANPVWYHTIEVAPGVTTPGYFDLRPVVAKLPWPDVEGRRCLDIGSFDGFYAFELERRGAAEVVAVDVEGPEDFDWPPHLRSWGPAAADEMSGGDHAAGFEIARELLGSSVERVRSTVYDIDPVELGRFDVVTMGSLLLHLREPLRALEAVRGVCRGQFLSVDQIDLRLTLLSPRRPVARLDGESRLMQWWLPNAAAHRRMVRSAGFAIERTSGPHAVRYGPSHAAYAKRAADPLTVMRALVGGRGPVHQAVLARPAA